MTGWGMRTRGTEGGCGPSLSQAAEGVGLGGFSGACCPCLLLLLLLLPLVWWEAPSA